MNEFKGTKGIWVIDDNYEGFVLTDSGAYKPNAMLQSCSTKEELKANAKAISAVPQMIKALQSIVNDFEGDYVMGGVIVDNPGEVLISNYKEAKEALKKAGL